MTRQQAHLRTTRRGDQDGFSLVEVIVTSAIMLVVLVMAFAVLSSLTNADLRAQALANNQDNLRLAIGQVARELRSSNPFVPADSSGARVSPTATSLRLALGATGPGQTFVEWKYDGAARQLLRSVLTSPTGAPSSSTVILRNVSTPGAGGMFQYWCLSGAPLDPASPTANADLPAFTSHIRIILAGATTAGPAPFSVQEDVQLRNIGARAC